MPLILSVGLSRKLGQPNYGSLGASCGVQVELESTLLRDNPESLQARARQAFLACQQAVEEELARGQRAAHGTEVPACRACACGHDEDTEVHAARRATTAQVRALRVLAGRAGRDLAALVAEQFTVDRPEALSATEAAQLIEELQPPSPSRT